MASATSNNSEAFIPTPSSLEDISTVCCVESLPIKIRLPAHRTVASPIFILPFIFILLHRQYDLFK